MDLSITRSYLVLYSSWVAGFVKHYWTYIYTIALNKAVTLCQGGKLQNVV